MWSEGSLVVRQLRISNLSSSCWSAYCDERPRGAVRLKSKLYCKQANRGLVARQERSLCLRCGLAPAGKNESRAFHFDGRCLRTEFRVLFVFSKYGEGAE